MTNKLKSAIIPVGGMGTRMLPLTKVVPKELLPVGQKAIIQYTIDEAIASGIERLIFVTGKDSSLIRSYLQENIELNKHLINKGKTEKLQEVNSIIPDKIEVLYVTQLEPKGLGHAVACAQDYIDPSENFAVLLPDDVILSQAPCLQQMLDNFNPGEMAAMVSVSEIHDNQIELYGVLNGIKQEGKCIIAQSIIEKPTFDTAPSHFAAIGRYILPGFIMNILKAQDVDSGGEVQLTDAISKCCENSNLYGYLFDGERFDCGSIAGYLKANIVASLKSHILTEEDILTSVA